MAKSHSIAGASAGAAAGAASQRETTAVRHGDGGDGALAKRVLAQLSLGLAQLRSVRQSRRDQTRTHT